MCVSCGCRKYDDDHGDKRNITMKDLRDASTAGEVSLTDVARNIDEAIMQTAGAQSGRQGGADTESFDTMSHGNTPTP